MTKPPNMEHVHHGYIRKDSNWFCLAFNHNQIDFRSQEKNKYHLPPGNWAYRFIRNTSNKDIALTSVEYEASAVVYYESKGSVPNTLHWTKPQMNGPFPFKSWIVKTFTWKLTIIFNISLIHH